MSSTDERLLNYDTPFVEQRGPTLDVPNAPKARKITATIPESINMRIRAISKAERRNLKVVITKCIEDYLKGGEDDTRPYIPLPLYHERTVKLSQEFDVEVADAIRERAENEGRSVSMVFTKALHEYIIRSPDDPVRVEPKLEPSSELEPNGGDL